ncbi:MAG: LCP family protein [Eubacterium sp.]
MRSKKNNRTVENIDNKPKSKQSRGLNIFGRIWGVLFAALSALFAVIFCTSGFFVLKLMIIAIAIIVLILVLLEPPLMSKRFKKSRKIIALVFSLAISAVYCGGAYYLGGTVDFLDKITNSTTNSFDVVVRDEDVYASLDDISGETVTVCGSGSDYTSAVDKLSEKIEIYTEQSSDSEQSANDLLAGETNVLLIASDGYDSLCSSIDSFDDDTKVLYKIKLRTTTSGGSSSSVDVKKEGFNIYFSGLDEWGSIDVDSRSDVNIVATVNPSTHTILLTSIPRDYYIEVVGVPGEYDKLTHSGIYGIDDTVATAESLLGLDMNYYVKVNYSTLVNMIDAMGGIEVVSEYSFYTSDGKYYFEEGLNEMDGEQALWFCRERSAFESGDLQRNKDQQLVLEAILNKLTSSSTLLAKYPSILNSLEDYIQTNMTSGEIKELIKNQLDGMPSWTIEKQSIIGESDMMPCYAVGDEYASVVLQDPDSIASAVAAIKAVLAGEPIPSSTDTSDTSSESSAG